MPATSTPSRRSGNSALDFSFRTASEAYVAPADKGIRKLRKYEYHQSQCHAITDQDSKARCRKFGVPLDVHVDMARTAIIKENPPYRPNQAINILPLLLCRYHLPDERYWTHMFFDLVDINEHNIVSIEQDFLVNPQLAAFLTAFHRRSPSSTPRGVLSPNTAMDYFPAKFTILLGQRVQCIAFQSNQKRCEWLVHPTSSGMQQLKRAMDPAGDTALLGKIKILAEGMLCDGHRTNSWINAYVDKWAGALLEMYNGEEQTKFDIALRGGRPIAAGLQDNLAPEINLREEDEPEPANETPLSSGEEDDTELDEERVAEVDEIEHTPGRHTARGKQSISKKQKAKNGEGHPLFELRPLLVSLQTSEIIKSIPANCEKLVQCLRENSHRRGIIPRAVMPQARRLLEQGLLMKHHFSVRPPAQSADRAWENLYDVHQEAIQLYNDQNPESAWNGVHHWVLRLAFSSREGMAAPCPGVGWCNITSAPTANYCRYPSEKSRRVDYAIVLHAEGQLEERINDILRKEEGQARGGRPTEDRRTSGSNKRTSINFVNQDHVRTRPIAVIIETKKAMGNEDEALKQLRSCASDHYVRLRQLMRVTKSPDAEDTSKLPAVPLILVCGHEWKFFLAQAMQRRLRIFHSIQMGTTESMVGLYQLIASLRHLGKWVSEVYQPWFLEAVLRVEP
ncbi:hypothetical protein B0J12DRAFT_660368 [Macrophomina phaseolina]|uniref:PD-(D/E)XK nuclease-like domain-containing protein n=1 Tax=Macrophomina phaseolina TaxID=35725 RepID=A0ABQ8GCH0_9PEZI|nr:hypothetical protein B0J12DRAFT_660368 [Macrophomina phaseolina]